MLRLLPQLVFGLIFALSAAYPDQGVAASNEYNYTPRDRHFNPLMLYGSETQSNDTELPNSKGDASCSDIEASNGPDICAQWVAANAARKSADLSRVTLTWNIASFAALILTLVATAWAAIASARSAKAATEANSLAKHSMVTEQRAWIAIDLLIDGDFQIGQDGGMALNVKVAIKNIGKTPALKIHTSVRMICELSYLANQEYLEAFADDEKLADPRWSRSLLPEQSYFRDWAATHDPIDRPLNGDHIVMPHIAVCVSYNTIFDGEVRQVALLSTVGYDVGKGYFPIKYLPSSIHERNLTLSPSDATIVN